MSPTMRRLFRRFVLLASVTLICLIAIAWISYDSARVMAEALDSLDQTRAVPRIESARPGAGAGTTFIVELPLAPDGRVEDAPPATGQLFITRRRSIPGPAADQQACRPSEVHPSSGDGLVRAS